MEVSLATKKVNANVIIGLLAGAHFKVVCAFHSNLEMLASVEGGKLQKPEKNQQGRDKNQQQPQPNYGVHYGNRIQAGSQ